MGHIEGTYKLAMTVLDGASETNFGQIAALVGHTGQLIATLVVITILIMASTGRGLDWGDAFKLIFTIVLVAAFMTDWTKFNTVADAVSQFFEQWRDGYILAAIGETEQTSFLHVLDLTLDDAAKGATQSSGILGIFGAALNALFWFLMVVFSAITICAFIVVEICLVLAFSMAPIAIMCLLTDKTKNYFETWFNFIIGALMAPVVIAAILGTVIVFLRQGVIQSVNNDVHTIGHAVPIGTALFAGVVLVILSPLVVRSLTGSLSLGGLTSSFSGGLQSAAKKVWSGTRTATRDTANYVNNQRKLGDAPYQNANRAAKIQQMMARQARYNKPRV